ncbi:hypothetical protein N7532_008347 [Penicillium argentinense]|uniref:NAD(P)-binding protein n=1 Tax=Penicillium argentinense TaxID=1131581 RepID=A0A9W9EX64_9EURO|nr:uncharacterized protein N7532_008347 [Penicillium argentinense]KAJ5089663.1 hypothetical protein N7532_008347 [Penicillium argentinense]
MASLKDIPNVTLLALDVTKIQDIKTAKEAVSSQTDGRLSCLVNNAARNHFMPFLDDDIDAAKRMFETNVWAPLAVTQAFAPLLIETQGALVNITSIAGHGPVPTLEQIAEVFRLDLAPFNVKRLYVVTGAVPTNGQSYFEDWALPSGSLYKPVEKIMASVVRATNGMARMPRVEYANTVVDTILASTTGRIWMGGRAQEAKMLQLREKVLRLGTIWS